MAFCKVLQNFRTNDNSWNHFFFLWIHKRQNMTLHPCSNSHFGIKMMNIWMSFGIHSSWGWNETCVNYPVLAVLLQIKASYILTLISTPISHSYCTLVRYSFIFDSFSFEANQAVYRNRHVVHKSPPLKVICWPNLLFLPKLPEKQHFDCPISTNI